MQWYFLLKKKKYDFNKLIFLTRCNKWWLSDDIRNNIILYIYYYMKHISVPSFDEEFLAFPSLVTRPCKVQGWVGTGEREKWTDIAPISEAAGVARRAEMRNAKGWRIEEGNLRCLYIKNMNPVGCYLRYKDLIKKSQRVTFEIVWHAARAAGCCPFLSSAFGRIFTRSS